MTVVNDDPDELTVNGISTKEDTQITQGPAVDQYDAVPNAEDSLKG